MFTTHVLVVLYLLFLEHGGDALPAVLCDPRFHPQVLGRSSLGAAMLQASVVCSLGVHIFLMVKQVLLQKLNFERFGILKAARELKGQIFFFLQRALKK